MLAPPEYEQDLNGFSNLSNIRGGEQQSEFLESQEADKLLVDDVMNPPKNVQQHEAAVSDNTIAGPTTTQNVGASNTAADGHQ